MTYSDLDEVLDIHFEAFKDHAVSNLGKKYNKNFIEFFITDSKSICLVAYKKNKILGYVFGSPKGYQKRLNKKIIILKYISVLSKPYILFNINVFKAIVRAFLQKIRYLKHILNINDELDYFSLVGIGVHSEFLGKKVGSLLCNSFENAVYKNGCNNLKLSVHSHNIRARKFYLKNGWKVNNEDDSIVRYSKSI